MRPWTHLDTDFLGRLATANVDPKDVDLVINTHVHADHVGWNTRLEGRDWIPTFPMATYLIHRDDFEYWNPLNGQAKRGSLGGVSAAFGNQNMFEDSVAPVHEAGQTLLWEGSYRIDRHLSLESAPGHTPGSSIINLESGSDRALFVGDLVHSPLQFLQPDFETCLSEDQDAAAKTRRRILERAADTNALVLPAHLPGHGGAEVSRKGSRFAIEAWADFDAVT